MNPYRKLRALLHPVRVKYEIARAEAQHIKELRELNLSGVWFDVGAHFGETTLEIARNNPRLTVYAFEPSPENASKLRTNAPKNYYVIQIAVSEIDGPVTLHLNTHDPAHSLLPLRQEGAARWHTDTSMAQVSDITVESIRLDTFISDHNIAQVGYCKVDAQGADLAVVRSAGVMLSRIQKIKLEVITAAEPLYEGESKKEDILAYMTENGFKLEHENREADGLFEDLVFVKA